MKTPQFPQDFKVLYAEGASYWWWSPDTGYDWDGTMPIGVPLEDWPVGLMIGHEDSASHELVGGEQFVVIWDGERDSRVEFTAMYANDDDVNVIIDQVLDEAGVFDATQ